jgi:hypothetical protein
MTDERFKKLLSDAEREYNSPPPTPSEEILGQIQDRRRPRRSRASRFFSSPKAWVPLAAAAVLLFGIMLGRDTLREDAAQKMVEIQQGAAEQLEEVRKEADREKVEMFYRYAATPYLSRAEALLTQYRMGSGNPETAMTLAGWTDELIVETKLLMDSPASGDPEMKELLQDLELTLLRIRKALSSDSDLDRELLEEGLTDNNLMMRLRAKLPAGGSRLGV